MKLATLALALSLAFASSASATDTTQEENGNPANTCVPALTQYDTGMRRRPLAFANESQQSNFINCSFRAATNSYGQNSFGVKLRSYAAAPVNVTCTGVIGVEDRPNNAYIIKTFTIAPSAAGAKLYTWNVSDVGGNRWNTNSSLQCLLPPGVAMTELPQSFQAK